MRIHYFSQLPFNEVDRVAAEFAVAATDLAIARTFSDHAVEVRQFRSRWNVNLLRSQLSDVAAPITLTAAPIAHVSAHDHDDTTDDEMPPLGDAWDSDDVGEPYESDSDSESDDGMPPLTDLSDSDSGYGSD
ncbi:hypothetical protein C8J56DRAFT_884020 [Mycena floridula]|nr:hypothetical protein C8J56DRAFT_884020 [Mycena floridula]